MNLNELQQETENIIKSIDKKLSANHTDETTMVHLIEELGELARQINNKNIRKIEQDKENLEEEISDVILLTINLANNNNINLEKAIINKIEKLKQRHNI